VARVYRALFAVPPSGTVTAALASRLDQGISRFQWVLDLLATPAYRRRRVQWLYRTLLHRPASSKELQRALAFLARGGTILQLEAQVLASDDYFRRRGGGTGAGFLAALAEDLPGQSVNPAALAEFAGQTDDPGARLKVTARVLRLAAVDRGWVRDLFGRFLHRAPDGEETGFYATLLRRQGQEEQLVAALLSSPRYLAGV
jgi:hypothetical protein